jgi:isopenicillin-N N-acyltransferase-like protein
MNDLSFPYIKYDPNKSYAQWGLSHGEEFRAGIKSLVEIRKELMLNKAPALKNELHPLAQAQFQQTKKVAPGLSLELESIAKGANLTLTDLIILNNYTDFRDIELSEEGCSTAYLCREKGTFAGQTWDMHESAKDYVCLIHVPEKEDRPEALLFSLVGCLGMMGINTQKLFVGVNNINTKNARTGLIWPVLIRQLMEENSFPHLKKELLDSPVTSGHNYLLCSESRGENWEITPEVSEKVSSLEDGEKGEIFHTNHCLGKKTGPLEITKSLSSTTLARYKLLDKKISDIKDAKQLKELLTDHEEYPKSICSHYNTGAQDPSMTCGGGIADFQKNSFNFWRGCPIYDDNYVEHLFTLKDKTFIKDF